MLKMLSFDRHAPWKQRFRTPEAVWMHLAASHPERGLLATNLSGEFQLQSWQRASGTLTQVTHAPGGIFFGFLSPDGREIYHHQGQEQDLGHYVRVPFEGGAAQDLTPTLPPYASTDLRISHTGNCIAFTAQTEYGSRLYCLERMPDGTVSDPRHVYQTAQPIGELTLSADGALVALGTTEHSAGRQCSLLVLESATGKKVGELVEEAEGSIEPLVFSPRVGDGRLLATTDRSGVKRPVIWHVSSGERQDLVLSGLSREVVPLDWSPDGKRVLLCQVVQAVHRLFLYELASHTLTPLSHPEGSFLLTGRFGVTFTATGSILALWEDATHPAQAIELDGETGRGAHPVLQIGEALPGSPARSVQFRSSDGQELQGWLMCPAGHGPFPTILRLHGGPHVVSRQAYLPDAQTWVESGFAFLSLNYRGSTSFGRAFERKIWGNPGYWEVEDLVAARTWLVAQGISMPDAILLTGVSYGGYLTLLALGKHPDLWAGGMAIAAITDWVSLYDESVERGELWRLFGGTPQEKPEVL